MTGHLLVMVQENWSTSAVCHSIEKCGKVLME